MTATRLRAAYAQKLQTARTCQYASLCFHVCFYCLVIISLMSLSQPGFMCLGGSGRTSPRISSFTSISHRTGSRCLIGRSCGPWFVSLPSTKVSKVSKMPVSIRGDFKDLIAFMPHLMGRHAQQLQFLWRHPLRTGASSDLGRCWNNIRH